MAGCRDIAIGAEKGRCCRPLLHTGMLGAATAEDVEGVLECGGVEAEVARRHDRHDVVAHCLPLLLIGCCKRQEAKRAGGGKGLEEIHHGVGTFSVSRSQAFGGLWAVEFTYPEFSLRETSHHNPLKEIFVFASASAGFPCSFLASSEVQGSFLADAG